MSLELDLVGASDAVVSGNDESGGVTARLSGVHLWSGVVWFVTVPRSFALVRRALCCFAAFVTPPAGLGHPEASDDSDAAWL